MLTISKAQQYVREYDELEVTNEEDDFQYIECLEFLIEKTHESKYMMDLGGFYYEQKKFDLAEEYYLMAAELKDVNAYVCLGYIYYYGRTGKPDYKKAFEYYKKGSDAGHITSAYKLADMYRNGYYVEKNYDEYARIIKSLYPRIKNATNVFAPLPEIFSRLAKIYKKEDNWKEAVSLLAYAKNFLAQRLQYTHFFGDLTIMKYLVLDLYSLIELDEEDVDIFDLYYIAQYPFKVEILYMDESYIVKSKDGYITMNGINYEDIDDFFSRVKIHGTYLSKMNYEVDSVEILKWKS